jgi:hypothetical protein
LGLGGKLGVCGKASGSREWADDETLEKKNKKKTKNWHSNNGRDHCIDVRVIAGITNNAQKSGITGQLVGVGIAMCIVSHFFWKNFTLFFFFFFFFFFFVFLFNASCVAPPHSHRDTGADTGRECRAIRKRIGGTIVIVPARIDGHTTNAQALVKHGHAQGARLHFENSHLRHHG